MKIIVSDFDGTLFGDDFEENRKAINDFVHRGNLFIIATGRAMNYLAEDLSMSIISVMMELLSLINILMFSIEKILIKMSLDQFIIC